MNKQVVMYVGLGVGLIAMMGAAILLFPERTPTSTNVDIFKNKQSQQQAQPSPTPGASPAPSQAAEGKYALYNEKDFTAASEQTRVLFFHAPWCPQCRALDTDILKQKLPANTTIFKVDYDTNQELRKKYGVTLQTTFVKVDANGDKIKSIVAYNTPTYATVKADLEL